MGKQSDTAPPEGYLLPRMARAMREKAGLGPSKMAARLGISTAAIYQCELKTNPCTEQTLRRYAEVLGLDFEAFMREFLSTPVGNAPAANAHAEASADAPT